jgi:hypothetical protein
VGSYGKLRSVIILKHLQLIPFKLKRLLATVNKPYLHTINNLFSMPNLLENTDIKDQDDQILSEVKQTINLVPEEQKPSIFMVSSTIPIDLYSPPPLDIILPKVIRIREKKDKKHLKKIRLLEYYFRDKVPLGLDFDNIDDKEKKRILHKVCPWAAIVDNFEDMKVPLDICGMLGEFAYYFYLKHKIFLIDTSPHW